MKRSVTIEILNWAAPPERPTLPRGEAHVWRARGADASRLARLALALSAEERARAARFHFERDRAGFIGAHGVLREILARYLAAPASVFAFVQGPFGKPSLAGAALEFNLSHCEGMALVALSSSGAVGVDAERRRAMPDAERLAAHFFARAETAALAALPAGARESLFFALWTRKEAVVKATGDGLSRPLDGFEALILEPPPAPCAVLCDLPLGPDHAGALASLAPLDRIRLFDVPMA